MTKSTKILLIVSIIFFIIAIGIFAFFKLTSNQISNVNTVNQVSKESNQPQEPEEFTFTDSDGNELKIDDSSELGKVIIFWNSDSENSLDTLELIDSYYETYKNYINFYIINTDEKHQDIITIVENCNFTFPVYYDNKNKASEFYSIDKLPTLIFIDKQDEIHTVNDGIDEDTLTANLDILAENY